MRQIGRTPIPQVDHLDPDRHDQKHLPSTPQRGRDPPRPILRRASRRLRRRLRRRQPRRAQTPRADRRFLRSTPQRGLGYPRAISPRPSHVRRRMARVPGGQVDQPAPAAPGQLAGYPTRCPHNLGRWSAGTTEGRTEGRKASSAVAGPLAGAWKVGRSFARPTFGSREEKVKRKATSRRRATARTIPPQSS